MVLVSAPVPKFAGANEDELTIEGRKKRQVFRCPVEGCRFVAERDRTEDAIQRRVCQVCKKEIPEFDVNYRNKCRACYKAHNNERNRARRDRMMQRGVPGKGSPRETYPDHSRRKDASFELRLAGARSISARAPRTGDTARRSQPQPQAHPWRTV